MMIKLIILVIFNVFISGFFIKLAWEEYQYEKKGFAVISSAGSLMFLYFAYLRVSEIYMY